MRLSWLPLTTAKANGSAVVKLFNLSLSLSLSLYLGIGERSMALTKSRWSVVQVGFDNFLNPAPCTVPVLRMRH